MAREVIPMLPIPSDSPGLPGLHRRHHQRRHTQRHRPPSARTPAAPSVYLSERAVRFIRDFDVLPPGRRPGQRIATDPDYVNHTRDFLQVGSHTCRRRAFGIDLAPANVTLLGGLWPVPQVPRLPHAMRGGDRLRLARKAVRPRGRRRHAVWRGALRPQSL
jgi:hypothetical protein